MIIEDYIAIAKRLHEIQQTDAQQQPQGLDIEAEIAAILNTTIEVTTIAEDYYCCVCDA